MQKKRKKTEKCKSSQLMFTLHGDVTRYTVVGRQLTNDSIMIYPVKKNGPHDMDYLRNLFSKRPKYKAKECNLHLDVYSKIALLKVSPSVPGLVSYSGEEEFIQGSNTIIESNVNGSIVLTSTNLIRRPTCKEFVENNLLDNLKVTVHTCHGNSNEGEVIAYVFYYNLVATRFKSESPLAAATLAHVYDSVSIASIQSSFQLRAHSRASNYVPGDKVVALGRYFAKDFDIMVAPGEYWEYCQPSHLLSE